jgi:hypothetical protein
MTDDHAPLESDQLDELLSADLDGELDAAARDLGLTRAEVEARLRATPGVDERRRALASARDQLASLPELDELLEARLRAKAVRIADDRVASHRATRRERRRRVLQAVGGIAAAAALVLAVGAALRHDSGSSSKSAGGVPALGPAAIHSQSPQPSAAKDALGTFADARSVALAAVTRANQVQKTAGAATRGAGNQNSTSVSTENGAVTSTVAPKATGTSADDATGHVATSNTPTSQGDAAYGAKNAASGLYLNQADGVARAVVRCGPPTNVSVSGTLALRASAVLAGRPVVVLVFSGKGGDTVVIENPDCTLKNIQVMG